MKETRLLMGMPVTVDVVDASVSQTDIDDVFAYFKYVDEKFSTYKEASEIMRINRGEIREYDASDDMKEVMRLSEETKKLTNGYFDIRKPDGSTAIPGRLKHGPKPSPNYDPSGLVKGWAIYNAADLLAKKGFKEFFVDAGGDIEARGKYWQIGIKNPFKQEEIVKTVYIKDMGIATSGNYIRGDHIYDPHSGISKTNEVVSLTVIGPNIFEADRFATAAFAMGKQGIEFLQSRNDLEAYMIDSNGTATITSGFELFTQP